MYFKEQFVIILINFIVCADEHSLRTQVIKKNDDF